MNADALSRLPCQQCGRVSHTSSTPIGMLTSGDITCGYSMQQLREMQLRDGCIGQLIKAKEENVQPSPNFAKSQPISFRRLLQQWEQLVIVNGVLYRQFVHASDDLSYVLTASCLRRDANRDFEVPSRRGGRWTLGPR